MKGRLLAAALAVFSGAVVAQQNCYEWRQATTDPWVESPSDAAQTSVAAFCAAVPGSATTNGRFDCQVTALAVTTGGFPSYSFIRESQVTSGCPSACSAAPASSPIGLSSRIKPGGCPSCPPGGEKDTFTGEGGIGDIPSSTCKNGCQWNRKGSAVAGGAVGGASAWAAGFESSGSACGTNDSNTGLASEGESGECDATGAICIDKGTGTQNCGIYNGNRVCVESTPPGGCVSYSDGGVACRGSGGSAPATPPAPNNGTSGVAATPDAQVQTGGGTTVNYYNSTTVVGSSSAPTTGAPSSTVVRNPTGSDVGEDSDGDGEVDGNGDGDGTGGGGECVGADCDAGVPELDDIGTLAEAFVAFWTELQNVPLIEAGANIAPSFSGGACPNWSDSVSVYGEAWEMDFTGICTTYSDLSTVLSFVMLVFFGFVSFRILFSA